MLTNNIDTKDISVVVQGAIDKTQTPLCLKSIRKYLPEAEIILSTWEGSDVSGLDYDVLVLNKDPGAIGRHYHRCGFLEINVNRQLVSSVAGIQKSEKKYLVKMRTDFYLRSAEFLNQFEKFPERSEQYKYFNHRVIVPSMISRMFVTENGFPVLFHPSDFFLFGMSEDIKDYFCGTKLVTQNEAECWNFKFPDKKPYPTCMQRYYPEQVFCYAWAKRHGLSIDFADASDWSSEKLKISNDVLFNNFIFLDTKQINLASRKHQNHMFRLFTLMVILCMMFLLRNIKNGIARILKVGIKHTKQKMLGHWKLRLKIS